MRERNAVHSLLEDARWTFSAMIYGLDVVWTPPASSRGVEEVLEISSVALIPRGDPGLTATGVNRENGFIFVLLEYHPGDAQQARLRGWRGQSYPAGSGSGTVSIYHETPRRAAMEEAVKQALGRWLRAREYNRPKEIRGRVALACFPRIGRSGGGMKADVSIKIDLKPPIHYPVD